ncbi:MAG: hypothetical protein WCL00_02210 [Bacteroidota bacterium]
MQRTLEQNTKLHALIGQLRLDKDMKEELVLHFTKGRSVSSKDMTVGECAGLISYFEGIVGSEHKRKEAIRHKMVWRLYFMLRDKCYFPTQSNKEAMESLDRFSVKIWNKSALAMTEKELSSKIGIVRTWKNKKTCQ